MKKLFQDILDMKDVKGVMLFSSEGDLIFEKFLSPLSEKPETKGLWSTVIASLQGIREADLVFEKSRLYIRKTEQGYLLVLMGMFAPIAMIRLNCDVLLFSLKQKGKVKGLKYFLKKVI